MSDHCPALQGAGATVRGSLAPFAWLPFHRVTGQEQVLSLGTANVSAGSSMAVGRPIHCGVFSSVPGTCPGHGTPLPSYKQPELSPDKEPWGSRSPAVRSTSSTNPAGHRRQTAVGPGRRSHTRARDAGTSPGQRRRVTAQSDRPGEGRAKAACSSAGTTTSSACGAVRTRRLSLCCSRVSAPAVRAHTRIPRNKMRTSSRNVRRCGPRPVLPQAWR